MLFALPLLHASFTSAPGARDARPAAARGAVGELPVPTLATPRLTLRAWRDDDLPAFRALNADPEVMRHFPSVLTAARSDELAAGIRAFLSAHGWGLWAVEERGGAPFLGFVGLSLPSFEAPFLPAVEVGWRLARHAWGKGYATEAAQAALRFGFTTLALRQVVSFTVPGNTASRRVMEKLHLWHDRDADFLHPRLPEGHPLRPHVLYRISFETWAARQRQP